MGFLHHLLWHRRRKPQTYRQYERSRQRRERFKDRYEAEHPQQAPETFQGAIRLADGTEIGCEHEHRTRSAAQACARQLAREHPGGAA